MKGWVIEVAWHDPLHRGPETFRFHGEDVKIIASGSSAGVWDDQIQLGSFDGIRYVIIQEAAAEAQTLTERRAS